MPAIGHYLVRLYTEYESDVLAGALARARREGLSLRAVILALLTSYLTHGLPK